MGTDRMIRLPSLSDHGIAAKWRAGCLSLVLLLSLNVLTPGAVAETKSGTMTLRGIYLSEQNTDAKPGNIGRLGIFLNHHGFDVQVPVDHQFKKGDQFRLKISAKQNGYFYVMHRQQNEAPELVWPRVESGNHLDDNAIVSSQEAMIPPAPLSFTFDDQSGTEYFYVVIRPDRKVPELKPVDHEANAPSDRQRLSRNIAKVDSEYIDRIMNLTIRGGQHTGGQAYQSVVYYPGVDENDRYVYFKAADTNPDETMTIMEFQLKHQ